MGTESDLARRILYSVIYYQGVTALRRGENDNCILCRGDSSCILPNDGWLDVFATCYDSSLKDVVNGLLGRPHDRYSNRLWHNLQGRGFEDRTASAGLDLMFGTMGSNFADFDNVDGSTCISAPAARTWRR